MFNDIKWLLTQQDSDLGTGVSVIQDRERPDHVMKIEYITNLLTVNGTNLLSGSLVGLSSANTCFSSVRTFFNQAS